MAVISLETVHSYSKYEHNFISVFTAWGQVYALYTVAFLGIVSANIKRHQKVEVYRVLRSIDKRLVELGSIVNYTNSRRNLLYAMAAFSSMPLVFSMVNCGVINSNYDAFVLCYVFICFFPMLIICLKEFQYYNLVLFVEKNLEEVNRHLRRMATPIVKAFPQGVAFSVTKYDQTCRDTVCELKKLSGIYTDLIDAGRKIQDIFGLHLLLIISTSFMVLTIQTYIIFSLIMKIIEMSPFRIFSSLSWMLVQSFAIVMNIHVCSKASKAVSIKKFIPVPGIHCYEYSCKIPILCYQCIFICGETSHYNSGTYFSSNSAEYRHTSSNAFAPCLTLAGLSSD